MRLAFHELVLRYASTRLYDRWRQSLLAASLVEHGQLSQVLVVSSAAGRVLIDGYRRVAALKALGRDDVEAAELPMGEPEALVMCHRLARGDGRSVLEEAWLLRELVETHGKGLRELAVELGRSTSWVSRRLGLLSALPESVERAVRRGVVAPHAAMRYLVPLARANSEHCELLVAGLGDEHLSARQLGRLYVAWRAADAERRLAIVTRPLLYLKAEGATKAATGESPASPEAALVKTLSGVSALCYRGLKQASECPKRPLAVAVGLGWQRAEAAFVRLGQELVAGDA